MLVTGGAGFIGSHLTERLLGMGARVTVYDRFDEFYPGKERNLAGAVNNPRFRLVNGDILDVDRLDSAMKDVDVVFHEAGQAGIGFSVKHPVQVNNVNVNGTLNVLSLGKKHGVRADSQRLVLLDLRQAGVPPYRRGPSDQPDLALRGLEARGGAVLQGVPQGLRDGRGVAPLLLGLRAEGPP